MSFEPDSASFRTAGDPLLIVGALWRGAMIDRYSRAEHFILRTLQRLKNSEGLSSDNGVAAMPGSRLQALIDLLEADRNNVRHAPALASLKMLQKRWEERNALSHGRVKVGVRCLTFRWTAAGKVMSERTLTVRLEDMLARLTALDDLQRALGAQLGDYEAALKHRAA